VQQKLKKQLNSIKYSRLFFYKSVFVFVLATVFFASANIFSPILVVSAKNAQKEIKDLNKKKEKKLKIKNQYVQEANVIKSHINNLDGNINSVQKNINRTENELNALENNIRNKEEDISINKKRLAVIFRKINRQNIELSLITLDSNKGLKEYIRSKDSIEGLQKKVFARLNKIKEGKRELEKKKEEEDQARQRLASQRSALEIAKNKKQLVLGVKNQKIQEKDKEIQKIERKINALRSALSSFLGKSFNFKDIVSAVKFASKKTGVRKEFLMAMLDKETDLGRFTGGCTYKNTRVSSANKIAFKKICKELGYNYKKKKISCALSYGYGGAMGVAQFMPTTWNGYKSVISKHTGHNPPDPWSLTDGVMGMAEKLKRAGASRKSKEHYAAKVYYCGGPRSRHWKTHCERYADTVISWAKGGYKEYF